MPENVQKRGRLFTDPEKFRPSRTVQYIIANAVGRYPARSGQWV